MLGSLAEAALAHVIAVEQNRATAGVALVVQSPKFRRDPLIQALARYFLSGGPDHETEVESPPTAVICARKEGTVNAMINPVNRGLPKWMEGDMLTPTTRPGTHRPLMFGTYDALCRAPLMPDAFDFRIISAFNPHEFTNFYDGLAKLEPAFTVLIVSHGMYRQNELDRWPQLGAPYMIAGLSPQPAQTDA